MGMKPVEGSEEENEEGREEPAESSPSSPSSTAAAAAASPKSASLTQQRRGLSGGSPAGASPTMTKMLDGFRSE